MIDPAASSGRYVIKDIADINKAEMAKAYGFKSSVFDVNKNNLPFNRQFDQLDSLVDVERLYHRIIQDALYAHDQYRFCLRSSGVKLSHPSAPKWTNEDGQTYEDTIKSIQDLRKTAVKRITAREEAELKLA